MSRLGGAIRFIAVVVINSKVAVFFFAIYETFRGRASLRLHESNRNRHAVALIGVSSLGAAYPPLAGNPRAVSGAISRHNPDFSPFPRMKVRSSQIP